MGYIKFCSSSRVSMPRTQHLVAQLVKMAADRRHIYLWIEFSTDDLDPI